MESASSDNEDKNENIKDNDKDNQEFEKQSLLEKFQTITYNFQNDSKFKLNQGNCGFLSQSKSLEKLRISSEKSTNDWIFTLNSNNSLIWEIYWPDFDVSIIQKSKDLILNVTLYLFFGISKWTKDQINSILNEIQSVYKGNPLLVTSITIFPNISFNEVETKVDTDKFLIFKEKFNIKNSNSASIILTLTCFKFDHPKSIDNIIKLAKDCNIQFWKCSFYASCKFEFEENEYSNTKVIFADCKFLDNKSLLPSENI